MLLSFAKNYRDARELGTGEIHVQNTVGLFFPGPEIYIPPEMMLNYSPCFKYASGVSVDSESKVSCNIEKENSMLKLNNIDEPESKLAEDRTAHN